MTAIGSQRFTFQSAEPALEIDRPYCDVLILCSKGTYVRSIARDLGQALNTLGCLAALRRLASGRCTTADCVTLAALEHPQRGTPREAVLSALKSADYAASLLPATVLADTSMTRLAHGGEVDCPSTLLRRCYASMTRQGRSGPSLALAGTPTTVSAASCNH